MGKRMDLVHQRRIDLTAHGTNPITICIFCRRLVAHYPSTLDHQRKSRKSSPEPQISKTSNRKTPRTHRLMAWTGLSPSTCSDPDTHHYPRPDQDATETIYQE